MQPTTADRGEQIMRELHGIFDARGSQWYGGEAISQREHALQSAMLAERASASPQLVVAALLHDIGHLLHDLGQDAAERGVDDRHEVSSRAWLAQRFGPAVAEPVAMHVEAKRYLSAVEPEYEAQLSPASQRSLMLQGGPMSREEVRQFEERPYFGDAVRLRRWDDAAKVVGLDTPPLMHFAACISIACGKHSAP